MTYKKASQLKEEIFILSHLFLVANYAIEGEEKYNKQLAIFKYNTKDLENNERFTLFLKGIANNKITYKQLITS